MGKTEVEMCVVKEKSVLQESTLRGHSEGFFLDNHRGKVFLAQII